HLTITHLFLFLFNAPATSEIYTLSLHDALPISLLENLSNKEIASKLNIAERTVKFHVSNLLSKFGVRRRADLILLTFQRRLKVRDRKSTRLNSSHLGISYAVFCLKKKKKYNTKR